MKQIKTILVKVEQLEEFDKRVNNALAEGWTLVKRYNSIEDAAKELKCSPSLISGVCRGVHKTTNGLHFQFTQKEAIP